MADAIKTSIVVVAIDMEYGGSRQDFAPALDLNFRTYVDFIRCLKEIF